MIERYQELLNDCIDIYEDRMLLRNMKLMSIILKGKLENVKNGLYVKKEYLSNGKTSTKK